MRCPLAPSKQGTPLNLGVTSTLRFTFVSVRQGTPPLDLAKAQWRQLAFAAILLAFNHAEIRCG